MQGPHYSVPCYPTHCLRRRQLMTLSFAGMGLSMLGMAAGLALPFLSGARRGLLLFCGPVHHLDIVGRACSCACIGARLERRLPSVQPTQHQLFGSSAGRIAPLAGMTGAIALVGTLSYILCFALGAGPVPGLLVPEITAARIRGARRFL